MRRLALIPARSGSRRVPGKNIAPVLGKPALHYPIEAAVRSGLFEDIHVSTESPEVREAAAAIGWEPDFLRPDDLAGDEVPILEVPKWAIREYRARGQSFDVVVTILPTAILLEAHHLAGAVSRFEDGSCRSPVLAVVESRSPIEKALQMDESGRLRPLRASSFGQPTQGMRKIYFDAGSFFIATPSQIESAGVTLEGMVGYRLPPYAAVDVDGAEDFELARRLLFGRAQGAQGSSIQVED